MSQEFLTEPKDEPAAYILDAYDMDALRRLVSELHAGNDRERDIGHRLWLIVTVAEKLPISEAELDKL